MGKLQETPRLQHSGVMSIREWSAWRKDIADAGGTLAVVTGPFALLHPGNLTAIRKPRVPPVMSASSSTRILPLSPRRSLGHQSLIKARPVPSLAVRLEMAANLRAVSLATTCLPGDANEVLARLRPFTLVDCNMSKTPGTVALAARKLADNIVELALITGCFTADIQKAIQDGKNTRSGSGCLYGTPA